MKDALAVSEIKKRGISGMKWIFLANGVGIPSAFLVALMLGRAGPEALGAYALAQISIGVIATFVVYGGPPVLSVFLPKLENAEERGRFVFSYLLVLLAVMLIVLCSFRIFPGVLEFLLQRDFDMRQYFWFTLLALMIVATETFANAASGLMLIKLAAVARQMMRLVLLPLIAGLFFFKRDFLAEHALSCILGGVLAGYLAAAVVSLVGILRDKRFSLRSGWLLPEGFWAFSASTMAATVFSFLYGNFDRMTVLAVQDLAGLGMYQAILSVNALLERIPALLLSSLVPIFSNLLGAERHKMFDSAFAFLCRWAVFPITIISLFVMGFSSEILGAFGNSYREYADFLFLFGLVAIIRSLNLPSIVVMTCKEKNVFRFLQQFFMISGQCALTLAFLPRYGIAAIAGAKMFCVSVASLTGAFYVFYTLGMSRRFPLSYMAAVLAGLSMTVLRILVVPEGLLSSFVSTFFCIAIFLATARFGLAEIRQIVGFFISRDGGVFEDSIRDISRCAGRE